MAPGRPVQPIENELWWYDFVGDYYERLRNTCSVCLGQGHIHTTVSEPGPSPREPDLRIDMPLCLPCYEASLNDDGSITYRMPSEAA